MRQKEQPYSIGNNINDMAVDNEEYQLIDLTHFGKNHSPEERKNGFRVGISDKVQESGDAGHSEAQSDEDIRNSAFEEFANKMKKAVSSKLMGRKINLKMKGDPAVVNQIVKMIKYETEYLNNIISGQAPDTPALQKNKAIIDREAKTLDRMLGVNDFWPFK